MQITTGSNTTTASGIAFVTGNEFKTEPKAEDESIPILAQRYAGLKTSLNKLEFVPINIQFGTFGVDEDAQCQALRHMQQFGFVDDFFMNHDAPNWHCNCGFYAVPADMLPKHSGYGSAPLILQVELSGKVIIHDEGYRAGHQRVLEVILPKCFCGKPSEVITFDTYKHTLGSVNCVEHGNPMLIEQWFREVAPELLENNDGPNLRRLLSMLDIKHELGINMHMDRASEIMGIPFKAA